MTFLRFALSTVLAVGFARLDGPQDNKPDNVRPVPPVGVEVSAADRAELEQGLAELKGEIDGLRSETKIKPSPLELLPDVQIYYNAVRYALSYGEFFNAREIPVAKALLKQGMERAKQLRDGAASWPAQAGLLARGYVSKIDGSVQPYGLVVPPTYSPSAPHKYRVDCWFHGRGETLSELNFINDRQRNPGEFTPRDTIVLHLYGRYCNANKLAGEVDLFEALDSVKKRYPVDENRISVRGFSMGGAACWQFAVHYAGDWAAAAPGAGFSETADFLKVFQSEAVKPTAWEQKLWHMYDCTDYAINLFNCPTVAYSGEVDKQKQAADMMEKALAAEGMELEHLIGKAAAHFYTPEARREIDRRLDRIMVRGSNPAEPHIRFTTWTLHYNKLKWVTIDGMGQHWERARINADVDDAESISVSTSNVTAFTLNFEPGESPLDTTKKPTVNVDGHQIETPRTKTDLSWAVHFRKNGAKWALVDSADDGTLGKRHGLQGPIDDAFMDSFVMVLPTGQPMNAMVGGWVDSESKHAIKEWRRQFRGEARVKKDDEITDEDIANSNLVLWGDPQSNKVLARIADKLPFKWDAQGIHGAGLSPGADKHALILIYPNPLNPHRYVVLNSGFTYREYDYLNNARQVPKLPDWAIVDLTEKPSSRWPGKIINAGFFDEHWKLGASR